MMFGPNGEGVIIPDWKIIGWTIFVGSLIGGSLLLIG